MLNLCCKWVSTGDPNDGPYDHTHPAASLRQMGGKKACEVLPKQQDPDDLATISHPGSRVGDGASNARRDIEAARRGSNEIWDNALNPFKLKSGSGDWVWCTDNGDDTREIFPSDRITLYH